MVKIEHMDGKQRMSIKSDSLQIELELTSNASANSPTSISMREIPRAISSPKDNRDEGNKFDSVLSLSVPSRVLRKPTRKWRS